MEYRAIDQSISVTWQFPVVFTRDAFAIENDALRGVITRNGTTKPGRVMVFLDANIVAADPTIEERASRYFSLESGPELVASPRLVPGGEAAKNDFRLIEEFMREMLSSRMDRQACVVIVGGGAVMDSVGLAAALVHRGLRQVRMPSTVLGQNDAGVGVKNGVNFAGGKNAIGTFAPPWGVVNDFALLAQLPMREWLCGVAEAFKVAIIRDADFFDWLCENARRFPARDMAAMEELVYRCAALHLEHIRSNGDPFEYGSARPLDFGHWSAHKLELLSGFRISHGEAVASGVLLDSLYAEMNGWITRSELDRIRNGLLESGFRLWHPEYDLLNSTGETRAIFDGLRDFQEHLGGDLCVTFPQGIGKRFEMNEINICNMERALRTLAMIHSASSADS